MSFLRSSSSSAFFLAAFDAAFFAGVADFFRGLAVSFEVFFIAMRRNVTQLRVDCELSYYSASTIVATRCRNAAAGSEQRPVCTGDV